ncbi:MAG: ABC transporter substrate-binding protein [Thermodesulfobacteriota bacterium]|nr:ABC transporter substrate-binding protein [Thermodesulfobacteriota bacterium]
MKRKYISTIVITVLVMVGTISERALAGDPEKKNLTYVEPGRYLIKLPVILAEAAGYFKEEGLNVRIRIAPGQRVYEALIAEDSDFIAVSYGSMMKINQRGKEVHSVCNITRNCLFHLVAQPEIKSIFDFKGKRIGVPKVGEEVTAVIRTTLKRKGLDPDKDVRWVSVGIQATMIAAMKRGDIDAVGAVGEWRDHLIRAVPGTHVIVDYSKETHLKEYLGATNYPLAHVQMTANFIEKYPETAQRVVNAVMKSLRFINTHTPGECIDVVKDKYWADADKEVLVEYLSEIKDAFSSDGITKKSGYDVVVKVNSEAGLLKMPAPPFKEITNLAFVKKANKKLSMR